MCKLKDNELLQQCIKFAKKWNSHPFEIGHAQISIETFVSVRKDFHQWLSIFFGEGTSKGLSELGHSVLFLLHDDLYLSFVQKIVQIE